MGDFEPYHQDERDAMAEGCAFVTMLALSVAVALLVCGLVLLIGDSGLRQVPQVQPIELRD